MMHTDRLEIYQYRNCLQHTIQRIHEGSLTLGFIGGSITDGRKFFGNWPETVIQWFANQYPDVNLTIENAAISATGSDLAVLRVERDLIDRGCDLVFVEYAVNDDSEPTEKRNRTREGLLRKLMSGDQRDVVLVYTFNQGMYEAMSEGRVPPSIAEFEVLAQHYAIGSVWAGLHAFHEVMKGRMRWEEWLPDGLHPEGRGSYSYGECVVGFLQHELERAEPDESDHTELPVPLFANHWGELRLLPLDQVERGEGVWSLRRWPYSPWLERALYTSAMGARLQIRYEGSALCLGFDFGKLSAEYRYRFDDGAWQTRRRERPGWCPDRGWFVVDVLGEALATGPHVLEIEVVHGNQADCTGTQFALGWIGIIP